MYLLLVLPSLSSSITIFSFIIVHSAADVISLFPCMYYLSSSRPLRPYLTLSLHSFLTSPPPPCSVETKLLLVLDHSTPSAFFCSSLVVPLGSERVFLPDLFLCFISPFDSHCLLRSLFCRVLPYSWAFGIPLSSSPAFYGLESLIPESQPRPHNRNVGEERLTIFVCI